MAVITPETTKRSGAIPYNPDRATRAQVLRWRKDGFPDFGDPVPDGAYQIQK